MNSKIITIHLIAAARPNFMKIAPLYHALKKEAWADPIIVHTGQHYDLNMSDAFFKDLQLPDPDIHLGIGSGTHAEQTGKVMIAYEKILLEHRPDLVIVVGDVNSTMACTLAASKIKYALTSSNGNKMAPSGSHELSAMSYELVGRRSPMSFELFRPPSLQASKLPSLSPIHRPLVAHLEAGLRSFDRSMPEETNRMVTDVLADILWTPSPDADENLLKEGIAKKKIHRVGNIMIDSLEMLRHIIDQRSDYQDLGFKLKNYCLVTLHRPSNVDDKENLKNLYQTLIKVSKKLQLVFPIHPRTRKNMEKLGLIALVKQVPGLMILDPLPYISFMNLVFNCKVVITDSGGIQEETTYLGIPCLTLRPNTERPVTITQGTNQLCTINNLAGKLDQILLDQSGSINPIALWDGKTAGRITESIKHILDDQY